MEGAAKTRIADEEIFGLKLGTSGTRMIVPNMTPTGSFCSIDSATSTQADGTPGSFRGGLPTPLSNTKAGLLDRRARLVLSDIGNGHAEVMFSPTPLKPSSPPRLPHLITPMRTPLARKLAARSNSSPALFRTPSNTHVYNRDYLADRHTGNDTVKKTPLQSNTGAVNGANRISTGLNTLKRTRDIISKKNDLAGTNGKRKRSAPCKTFSQPELGRGKENIDPNDYARTRLSDERGSSLVRTSRTTGDVYADSDRSDRWRAIHTTATGGDRNTRKEGGAGGGGGEGTSSSDSPSPSLSASFGPKKLSAEECALSLVSLAHGK